MNKKQAVKFTKETYPDFIPAQLFSAVYNKDIVIIMPTKGNVVTYIYGRKDLLTLRNAIDLILNKKEG